MVRHRRFCSILQFFSKTFLFNTILEPLNSLFTYSSIHIYIMSSCKLRNLFQTNILWTSNLYWNILIINYTIAVRIGYVPSFLFSRSIDKDRKQEMYKILRSWTMCNIKRLMTNGNQHFSLFRNAIALIDRVHH